MAFAAIYDTNVLIPHEIRDILMISASTRVHAVYWSEDIFKEWRRNALDKKLAPEAAVLRFQSIMNDLFPDALILRYRYANLIDSMTNDPKDRHILAAAIVAEADVIVTNNLDDFPPEAVERYGIEIQSPDEFVRVQASLNPGALLAEFRSRALERNSLSLRRGFGAITPEDIALFLRDGPSGMPQTGQFILDLLNQ